MISSLLPRSVRRLFFAPACAAVCICASAGAQTSPISPQDAELIRKENQLLREEIRAADQQIELLLERVVLLERQLGYEPINANDRSASTDDAQVELVLPDDALASPSTVLRELSKRYEERFGDEQSLTEDSQDVISKWCREVTIQLRGKREWIVSIGSITRENRRLYTALFVVYDADTRRPISEPFRSSIPERFATRVQTHREATLWRVSGLVIAEPKFTPDRIDPGVFNYPPLVGPFVEFAWRFVWYGIAPFDFADADKGQDAGAPAQDGPNTDPGETEKNTGSDKPAQNDQDKSQR